MWVELQYKGASVFVRVQAAGPRAEGDVAAGGIVIERGHAVPQARAAMHALLAIERRERLSRPGAMAWPEHISMHSLETQRSQKSG